jgi:hypothetical protein
MARGGSHGGGHHGGGARPAHQGSTGHRSSSEHGPAKPHAATPAKPASAPHRPIHPPPVLVTARIRQGWTLKQLLEAHPEITRDDLEAYYNDEPHDDPDALTAVFAVVASIIVVALIIFYVHSR